MLCFLWFLLGIVIGAVAVEVYRYGDRWVAWWRKNEERRVWERIAAEKPKFRPEVPWEDDDTDAAGSLGTIRIPGTYARVPKDREWPNE